MQYPITTEVGRVVYKRKTHFFTYKDINRILLDLSEDIDSTVLRTAPTPGYIRANKRLCDNLYHYVWDLFSTTRPEDAKKIKEAIRALNDDIVEAVADAVFAATGVAPAGWVVEGAGKVINRAVEFIFTGSTGL